MRKSISFLTLACVATASALAVSDRDTEALARGRQLQLEFRQGNLSTIRFRSKCGMPNKPPTPTRKPLRGSIGTSL